MGIIPAGKDCMDQYSVVDNRYRGEGFAWVIENLDRGERWKYGFHGEFCNKSQADALALALNNEWGEV